MKSLLLLLGAASMIGGETAPTAKACPVPAAAGAAAGSNHTRHDPLMLDLNNNERKAAPGTCSHAISTKGTGMAGRVSAADHAINTKGTGASGRADADRDDDCDGTAEDTMTAAAADSRLKLYVDKNGDGTMEARDGLFDKNPDGTDLRTAMAIKTKGTGATRVAGPGPADCNDSDAGITAGSSTDANQSCGDSVAAAAQAAKGQQLAINCKGTGAK